MALKKDKTEGRTDIPVPSTADLRGRQSVRATFKLTERAIDTISIVSVHLGIKQKSLFDHLIEDARTLDSIARQIEIGRFKELERTQKTFVLSRGTLIKLEAASALLDLPRDALVEYSIRRLKAIIEEEREKHGIRKRLLQEVREFVEAGRNLLADCRRQLGDEDPMTAAIEGAIRNCDIAGQSIENLVEKGKAIEKY